MKAPRHPRPTPREPPDEAALRDAALAYLARYSTTQAGLLRVLGRRIHRWARAVAEEVPDAAEAPSLAAPLAAARAVVTRLAAAGAVSDAGFAASRARALRRAGRSSHAITAHLHAKGVPSALTALPDDPAAELAAALLYAARRRMGPFRPTLDTDPDRDPAARVKLHTADLARLARAGFPAAIAHAALGLTADEAEARLLEARRG